MTTKSNPWAAFHSTHLGENIQEVVETEECKVLRINDTSGEGSMTMYRVFDGIFLMYNDFHMRGCYSRFTSQSSILCIDHCREGRIEHRTNHGMLYYMEEGDLRVDRRVHHTGAMDFPLCHYHGITIGFFVEEAQRSIREAVPGIPVDLSALAQKFSNDENPFVLRQDKAVEHIFSELYHVPVKIRMDYFRIKVLELLVYLNALELTDNADVQPLFYSSHIEKIKAVHRFLISDLRRNYTAEVLAGRFSLSVSALKTGFKGVYGAPLYSYIRAYKMHHAATLLVQNPGLRIIDVAARVGYDNPSKFAAAFKSTFGMTPAQYRSNRREKIE